MKYKSQRQQTREKLAAACREAETMQKVRTLVEDREATAPGFLTDDDVSYVQKLVTSYEAAVEELEEHLSKMGGANYCDWRRVVAQTIGDVHCEGQYTLDTDDEGWYHWKVNMGDVKYWPLVGNVNLVRREAYAEGKCRKRRDARDKAYHKGIEAINKATARLPKSRKPKRAARKAVGSV